jgi:hypothetical protein
VIAGRRVDLRGARFHASASARHRLDDADQRLNHHVGGT